MWHFAWVKLPLVIAAASAMPLTAHSQETQQSQDNANQTQVAERCLADLAALSQRLSEEQFWTTDRGGIGGPRGPGEVETAPLVAPGAVDPATGAVAPGADPFGIVAGALLSPRNEIGVLFGAAEVLARQGKQDACDYVLAELVSSYEDYTRRLREAGVDPTQITDWRQEQIALALPVSELTIMNRLTVSDLLGTGVRNLRDESLGSITDVVFDRSGQLRYMLLTRGGFFGIGQDRVPVPWQKFRMAPGLNTLVLNVSKDAMDVAPAIGPRDAFNPDANAEKGQVVDEFWSDHRAN